MARIHFSHHSPLTHTLSLLARRAKVHGGAGGSYCARQLIGLPPVGWSRNLPASAKKRIYPQRIISPLDYVLSTIYSTSSVCLSNGSPISTPHKSRLFRSGLSTQSCSAEFKYLPFLRILSFHFRECCTLVYYGGRVPRPSVDSTSTSSLLT